MRRKYLPFVILLSIAVSFALYFFISKLWEEPEIQIEYVLPDEPIKTVTKRRSRYYATHAQTTGVGEQHESMEVQHELLDEMERDKRDFNTSLPQVESHSLNEEGLNESVQEAVSLEESIAKLKEDRKSALATYQEAVDAIIKYGRRENELLGEDKYLELSGFEEDSPQRAAVLRELSEIAFKSEELGRQKDGVKLTLSEINQELPTLETRLKALLETPWDVDNTEF